MSANQTKTSPFNRIENKRLKIMNNKTATLEDAITIAAQAHKGETDKAGACYILHPIRLMMKMKTESEMMAAVLHDVVEDTDWAIEMLREQGFSEEVLEAVECLTKRSEESYEEFIERAGTNPIARRVKIADLEDNMDVKRLETLTDEDVERIAKYLRAWRSLNLKTADLDINNPAIKSDMIPEQPTTLKEKRFKRLTPEQEAKLKASGDRMSEAVINGLHRDNIEIFGEDYIKKSI